MPEELLALVDEHNRPLGGTKARSVVHRDGDWHRTVHIYLINAKGEFLVHLRSPLKDLSPNKWDTRFGGHVVAGKTLEDTVQNELKNELGIDVKVNQLIEGKTYHEADGKNNEFTKVYYYRFDGDLRSLTFDDKEVQTVRWMSPPEILGALKTTPGQWAGSFEVFTRVHRDFQEQSGQKPKIRQN